MDEIITTMIQWLKLLIIGSHALARSYVCGPHVVTKFLNKTLIFDAYMTRLAVKSIHEKTMRHNEIGERRNVDLSGINVIEMPV